MSYGGALPPRLRSGLSPRRDRLPPYRAPGEMCLSPQVARRGGPVVESFTSKNGLADYGCLASGRVGIIKDAAKPFPKR